MSKTKTVKMKLLYIIATLAALAMLIPVAVPVSAASYDLDMTLVDASLNPIPFDAIPGSDEGYNAKGSTIMLTVPAAETVTNWKIWPLTPFVAAAWHDGINPNILLPNVVYVDGVYGEANIVATCADGDVYTADKKWGHIYGTAFTVMGRDGPVPGDTQDIAVTWNETGKNFEAHTTLTDTVTGEFVSEGGAISYEAMQGTVLNWYLVAGWENPNVGTGEPEDLMDDVDLLDVPDFASFSPDSQVTEMQTVTDADGSNTVDIYVDGEESVYVIVVPAYPIEPQMPVTAEVASINFYSYEMEKVPQVRWAGEKIVLEKFFGLETEDMMWPGTLVRFSLENQSPGALEGIDTGLLNLTNTAQTVWTVVDEYGYARCMLVSESPGEVDVDLAVYDYNVIAQGNDGEGRAQIINQHGFVVYYLKLEEVTLGNVVGKRADHFEGPWTPPNPWDPSIDIPADPYDFDAGQNIDRLNVSQDALLRARVKGWFMGDNLSNREARVIDSNGNGVIDKSDTKLPEGRWVLPDDWEYLAGPEWIENRLHWDIMDNPTDSVLAEESPLGPYYLDTNGDYEDETWDDVHHMLVDEPLVAEDPVIGPFRPGIELPTPYGYDPCVTGFSYGMPPGKWAITDPEKSVVPNGVLEWWDAPMPPAKITFKLLDPDATPNSMDNYMLANDDGISDHAGFFKTAEKAEIYYLLDEDGEVFFTNPFYCEQIPAFPQIPAMVNNGGYDWNSWNTEKYGPYGFWWFVNKPLNEVVSSTDSSTYPTKVQVYSDNHGEAMVYLNGDFNLNLWPFVYEADTADVPPGELVATSTVVAIADYPYFRKHVPLVSNEVEKDWLWGGDILGTNEHLDYNGDTVPANPCVIAVGMGVPKPPVVEAQSNKLMAWVWLTDRDNLPFGVEDAVINWSVDLSGSAATINDVSGYPISDYNTTTLNLGLQNGFLDGTYGDITDRPFKQHGTSGVKPVSANSPEAELFLKFWPTLDPTAYCVAAVECIVDPEYATTVASVHVQINSPEYGLYPGLVGHIDRWIGLNFGVPHPLDDIPVYGDANIDGVINMGDVTAVERIILGLTQGYIDADANIDGTIDMGDVVKVERMILGLD